MKRVRSVPPPWRTSAIPWRSERILHWQDTSLLTQLTLPSPPQPSGLRTLDDSANKRISVAEAFLTVDAILNIYMNVASGLVVYPKVINKRIMSELPFMATENILMDAVKNGGDRQELHELIREHSMDAGRVVKEQGGENDLIDRIVADPAFNLTHEDIDGILKPENFIGRCESQVQEFIDEYVDPVLAGSDLADEVELTV